MAIWGWSYGGFVTASVLALDAEKNNIFKVNAAVLFFTMYTITFVLKYIPSLEMKMSP